MVDLNAGGLLIDSWATATAADTIKERRNSPSGGGVVTGGHLTALSEVKNITSGTDYSTLGRVDFKLPKSRVLFILRWVDTVKCKNNAQAPDTSSFFCGLLMM